MISFFPGRWGQSVGSCRTALEQSKGVCSLGRVIWRKVMEGANGKWERTHSPRTLPLGLSITICEAVQVVVLWTLLGCLMLKAIFGCDGVHYQICWIQLLQISWPCTYSARQPPYVSFMMLPVLSHTAYDLFPFRNPNGILSVLSRNKFLPLLSGVVLTRVPCILRHGHQKLMGSHYFLRDEAGFEEDTINMPRYGQLGTLQTFAKLTNLANFKKVSVNINCSMEVFFITL